MSRINAPLISIISQIVSSVRKAFTGSTSTLDGKIGMVPAPLITERDKFLTGSGAWKSEKFKGIHNTTVDYEAGAFVAVNGTVAYSNGAVSKDTAFSWGKTGATWSPLLDSNVTWQGVYSGAASYAINAVVVSSNSQSLLYRSLTANNMGKSITDTTAWAPYHPMVDMSSLINQATGTSVSSTPSTVLSKMLIETTQLFTGAITGTPVITFELSKGLVLMQTVAPSSNWTINVNASVTQTLNDALAIGQTITFTHLVQMGTTAFMPTSVSIDGQLKTELWASGLKPSSGIPSALNCYSYTIVKTADASFVVLCDQGSFK